jgi:hypothetical protein
MHRYIPGKCLEITALLAAFILPGISMAQPVETVPQAPVQTKIPASKLNLRKFTYDGKQGICELPPATQELQQGEVETAPPPRLPSSMLPDLTVLGVKHMFVKRGGEEYVRVIARIANNSDRRMRGAQHKVFFRIGGETHACLAPLPQLDAHRMVNLSREVQLRRGLNYRVTVIADFPGTEQEVNEENNEYIYTIRMK